MSDVPDSVELNLGDGVEDAIRAMSRESADGSETGGILLGLFDEVTKVLTVTEAGAPGPRAVREPARFSRDLLYARDIAREAWVRDRSQWIGEWHTHPRGPVQPSQLDLSTYVTHLTSAELGFEYFVAIIVTARNPRTWEDVCLTTWVLSME